MKLVVAIVNKEDEKALLEGLNKNNLSATKLEAEGVFLKKKNHVFLIGVKDGQVKEVVSLIKKCCTTKKEQAAPPAPRSLEPGELLIPEAGEIKTSGAVILILEVSEVIKS